MKNIIKIIGGIIVVVLLADVIGFMLWILSEQIPVDNFYLGSITANTLRAVVGGAW